MQESMNKRIKVNMFTMSSVLIAILPILSIYKIGLLPMTFGDAATVYIVIVTIIGNINGKFRISRNSFMIYFAVFFVISLMFILIRGQKDIFDFAFKWLRIVTYYFVIDISSNDKKLFDLSLMQRVNVLAGVLVSGGVFVQVLFAVIFKKMLTFFIPGIPLAYGKTSAELALAYSYVNTSGWRPISIFCEPAHFAQFALLSLAISLFCKDDVISKKTKNAASLLITVAIVLSKSANGLFLAIMLWAIWFCVYYKDKISLKKMLFGIPALAVGIAVLINTDFLELALKRLQTVNDSGGSTGTVRLLQGLAIFDQLNPVEKILGIGYGNIQPFLVENNITTAYLSELGNEYMNGFSTVLISGGIVGLIAYLAIWIRMFFVHNDSLSRAIFLIITVLFCTSAMFYSCSTVMYLVFICCQKNKLSKPSQNGVYSKTRVHYPSLNR